MNMACSGHWNRIPTLDEIHKITAKDPTSWAAPIRAEREKRFLLGPISSTQVYVPMVAARKYGSALGGRKLNSAAWIVPWQGTADSLCVKLQPRSDSGLVVCSLST